jgi:DNA-binding protein H-NS
MKLSELKAKVYEFAAVSTTKALKAKYEELRSLDLRRKISWEKALTIVQKQQDKFETWLENPPEEYRELFAEIEEVSERFDRDLIKAEQLSKEVNSIADNLDTLAEDCRNEAAQLNREIETAKAIAEYVDRN